MYSALIRQTIKPSGLHITRLARASFADKVQSRTPPSGGDEYFVTTTFPDDFESSPLKPDAQGTKTNVKGFKEAMHEASAQAKQAQSPAAQRAKSEKDKLPSEMEKEPELDEM
ncbi:hypothetical protein N7510_003902 [Penicillium lagena]|uniref:uncharacterized protein n=1 Tax=Penicillium lagena TaxID=94218 RepID=UPI00253FC5BB|nr:uncharacterized protein N7510_003902 [Penicillium lagena]KAJ5619918.1 hypothetical protein N7510_003902 [Penicillium lagena]